MTSFQGQSGVGGEIAKICPNFSSGQCRFGSSCRYSHAQLPQAGARKSYDCKRCGSAHSSYYELKGHIKVKKDE